MSRQREREKAQIITGAQFLVVLLVAFINDSSLAFIKVLMQDEKPSRKDDIQIETGS